MLIGLGLSFIIALAIEDTCQFQITITISTQLSVVSFFMAANAEAYSHVAQGPRSTECVFDSSDLDAGSDETLISKGGQDEEEWLHSVE